LIWLDYLRRREPRVVVEGLALFVPENHERTTCLRVRHLDANQAAFSVFVYADGVEQRVDIADAGNLDTRIGVRESGFDLPGWTERLLSIPGVERIDLSREHVSWRVRGLEFARWNGAEVRFGIDSRHPAGASNLQEIEAIARELSHFRSPDSANSSNPLYTRCPERWLESQIRGSLTTIDASLLEAPVYGQVPSFAATDRGVIDLLACGFDGRLAVVEVKASEDLHLPLQALDYWMRVKWHAAQNDFSRKGYFPGVSVGLQAPRMLLIAPALSFHPTTDTILRFFSPEVEVERIGVSMTWRKEMRIVLRTSRVSPSG
jgi:hypothetical protein